MNSNYQSLTATLRRLFRHSDVFIRRVQMSIAFTLCFVISGCGDSETHWPLAGTRLTVNVVQDFGAKGDGVTDDEPALQAALDYVASKGGGVVYLPAGTYGIARPIVLRSNVHLNGDGYGKSIVRSKVHSLGKYVDGTGIWAAIALLAADHASVSGLTVDLASAATHANGIAMLPLGGAFEGTPSSHCTISNVEVLGGGNYHAYMIWNFRGRGITITNNVVDGGILDPVDSYQEGIESYGGKDVFIGWNTVRNIGNTALNFGSAGLPDTGIDGLVVVRNVIRNSGRGLNMGPWLDPAGPQNIANVRIEENTFHNLWRTGMYIPVQAGTAIDGLRIAKNTIENIGREDGVGAAGIQFQGSPATEYGPASAASNTMVMGNHIRDIRGINSIGILVNYYPGLVVSDNEIDGAGYGGIQAFGSTNLTVEKNLITNTGRIAVGSYGPQSSISMRDNIIVDWALASPATGVLIDNAVEGDVRDNEFQRYADVGSVVIVAPTAANVVVFGNSVTSTVETLAQEGPRQSPFINLGAQSNLGSFVATPGVMTIEIGHPLVKATSHLIVEQLSGDELNVTATPRDGVIAVTFAVAPQGLETFRYEIDP
jgi:hypothetical protein